MEWNIDFDDLMEQKLAIVTIEGQTARGRLKSIEWHEFELMGQQAAFPKTFHLDSDYHVDFHLVASIELEY